jgi:hypothetical protein
VIKGYAIGAGHGLPAFQQIIVGQSVGEDIVAYVNGHLIQKELTTQKSGVVAVQDFATGFIIVQNSNCLWIVVCAKSL